MSDSVWAIAIHGGSGPSYKNDYAKEESSMRKILDSARKDLKKGAKALDVVQEAVAELEDSGQHIAGRGSCPNAKGKWELDAAIMDGSNRRAGAVGALQGYKNPIECARTVMTDSPHILMVGKGAEKFLKKRGLKTISNPNGYYKPMVTQKSYDSVPHGTVGAVALDSEGHLAAATSTGGLTNKPPGRISDSAVIGSGTWADERVAVSCTGQGEYFMRVNAASDVSARIRYTRSDLANATACVLEEISLLGGQGGLIAIDRLGRVAMPFNTIIMKRGFATWRDDFDVKVF